MYDIEQLRRDIAAVVEYNWQAEAHDYNEQDHDGRENHIFKVLVRLDDFVTPDSPFDSVEDEVRQSIREWDRNPATYPTNP